MQSLPKDKILEFHPDTMVAVRKKFNLDKPGQMDEAIDLLDAWIKKQSHFVRKDYPREYLERVIILMKGSVERAKGQLEKLCTLRTMLPHFFNNYTDPKKQFKHLEKYGIVTLLPKLTDQHNRKIVFKYFAAQYTSKVLQQLYYFVTMTCEYMKAHDYSDGVIFVLDHMEANIMDFVAAINFLEMKQIAAIFMNLVGIMQSLPKDKILEYNPDTLVAVRKLYNLDKPGQMDEAIDLLDAWVKKQSHFVKKDYSKEYMERVIILMKGSVERAKEQLEKICTLRTLLPQYFNNYDNPKKQFKCLESFVRLTLLPKLRKDHVRMYLVKFYAAQYSSKMLQQMYYYIAMTCEYMKAHDYSDGVIVVLDFKEVNIIDFVAAINILEMKQMVTLFLEAYNTRAKNFFVISASKAIDILISIFKQMLSEKLAKRLFVLKEYQELYEHIPQELFPIEYGGEEKSLTTIFDNMLDVLSTKENKEYWKEMSKACTMESMRVDTKISEEFLGLNGTFRSLSVD